MWKPLNTILAFFNAYKKLMLSRNLSCRAKCRGLEMKLTQSSKSSMSTSSSANSVASASFWSPTVSHVGSRKLAADDLWRTAVNSEVDGVEVSSANSPSLMCSTLLWLEEKMNFKTTEKQQETLQLTTDGAAFVRFVAQRRRRLQKWQNNKKVRVAAVAKGTCTCCSQQINNLRLIL